ncbi:MAG: hypothetical protein GY704_01575, partial [Phycisphaeraceae bacterium]|nr:hypothetical protein [Phycisphaeraceae bacterium]
MDPNDPDVIFAGTGEVFTQRGLPGAGILKSIDGGGVWTQLEDTVRPEMYFVSDISTHPWNSNFLIACVCDVNHSGAIFRSGDGGDHWYPVLSGLPTPATHVKYDLDDPLIVIAGCMNSAWRSDDGGSSGSWTCISTVDAGTLPANTGRVEIAFAEDSDLVYASCATPRTGGDDTTGSIYRS